MMVIVAKPCCAQEEYPSIYKTKFQVINVHQHCDSPSAKAIKAELEVMDRVGVDTVVILDGHWTGGKLLDWIELRKEFSKRVVLFANIEFALAKEPDFSAAIVRELNMQYRLGVQGIKVFKEFGMHHRDGQGKLIAIDDLRLDPYWQRCGELGLPVLIHSADPKECWSPKTYDNLFYEMPEESRQYGKPGMPQWEELIRQRNNLLKKHPQTKFISAHMGNQTFELVGLAKALDQYPNLYVECSARIGILGRLHPQAVRDFFIQYQDRILFGTDGGQADFPTDPEEIRDWQERETVFYSRHLRYFETDRTDIVEPYGRGRHRWRLAGVALPHDILKKFYSGNAAQIIPGLKRRDSSQ